MERQVLETLERTGPRAASRLPVRWPLIRMHLPLVIERLSAAGLVRVEPSATGVLTPEGMAILDANRVGAAPRRVRVCA
jgi:Mn-dependent DtxR family transcriptional regulator